MVIGVLIGIGLFGIHPNKEQLHYLSVSINGRAPDTYVISDYRRYGEWLWYLEPNGTEVMVNVHASHVIIQTVPDGAAFKEPWKQ